MEERDVFIVSAVRTAMGVGKPGGALHEFHPVDLSAMVMKEAVKRAGVEMDRIEDVLWGCVTAVGDQGANMARLAALKAGFPVAVPAVTMNRMCSSSQSAVHFGAQAILAGDMDLVVAGGTEMMSHQPIGADYPEEWPQGLPLRPGASGHQRRDDGRKMEPDPRRSGRLRLRESHARREGHPGGIFRRADHAGQIAKWGEFKVDQGVRFPPDREKMRTLKTVFKADGVVTAANASQISDGTAALVLASPAAVGRYNLNPLARIVARVVVGTDPVLMLDGAIPATHMVLEKAGLSLDDMDVIEVNEAFASVVAGLGKGIPTRYGQGQSQRRRHRPRTSGRRDGRHPDDQAGPRVTAAQGKVRPADHVRRSRSGHGDDH